jgi:hypothetical protein
VRVKANADEINRKQTERRRANKDEVNRKQREYNRKRTALRKAAKSSSSSQEQLPTEAKGHALPHEQSPTSALQMSIPVSAEESVKNWLAFRAERNPAPDKNSLADWLAYRESHATAVTAASQSRDRSRDPEAKETGHRDGDATNSDPKRSHQNDLGN